jgi:hypothetical protein
VEVSPGEARRRFRRCHSSPIKYIRGGGGGGRRLKESLSKKFNEKMCS